MERLTDCAQGYCEMYCKKYMLCFEDPEDCIFKDEIKLYDAIKSIEGIVPFDRLLELACADKAGRLVVLPCKVGDTVYFTLLGRIIEKPVFSIVSFSASERIYCAGTSEYFRLEDFGKTVFLTREEAEAALAQKGGTHEADSV